MTELLEQRLRSAMSPPARIDPATGGSADSSSAYDGPDRERWSRIEAAAQRRKDRSDLGQRVAMVASVFLVAGSAVALGSGNLLGTTEAGRVPRSGVEINQSSDHTVWRWLLVLVLTAVVGNGIALLWRRIPDWYFAFQRPTSGRWGRVAGTMIVAVGFALPLLVVVSSLLEINRGSYPGSVRLVLPLNTVAGSLVIALGAFLAWRGTRVGSWLGTLLLVASAAQAGLAIRALLRVKSLLDQHDRTPGVRGSEDAFNTLHRRVGAVGDDLYPLGSGSLIFLLLPWIIGSILVFGSRSRARAWSISLGLAVTVATYVTFHSMDAEFISLID